MTPATLMQMTDRYHRSPSTLWFSCLLGSVFIHLFGFWMVSRSMMRQHTVELSAAPVPVQLLEIGPRGNPEAQPQLTAIPTQTRRVTRRRVSRSTSRTSFRNSPQPTSSRLRSSRLRQPDQAASAVPDTQVASSSVRRRRVISKTKRRFSEPAASTAGENPSSTAPSKRGGAATSPISTKSGEKDFQPTAPEPQVPTTPPTQTNQPPVASQPNPSEAPSQNETNPDTAESQFPVPTESRGVLATVVNISSGNGGRDEPQKLARPRQEQKQFSSVDYPLPVGSTAGQPVVLQALLGIDERGQPEVKSVQVVQGDGNFNAKQFVNEIVQDWKFEPAFSEGSPVYSLLDVSIRISPLSG